MSLRDDLTYFTHEVGGRSYGGWYRRLPRNRVEVFVRGHARRAWLAGLTLEERARVVLEELARVIDHATIARSRRQTAQMQERCATLCESLAELERTLKRAQEIGSIYRPKPRTQTH